MTAIERFFGDTRVRILIRDGEPWFVAADVCRALGLGNGQDAIGRLDPDGVDIADVIDSMGRNQSAKILNEGGMYELTFQSRIPSAVRFRKWVARDVLPPIRFGPPPHLLVSLRGEFMLPPPASFPARLTRPVKAGEFLYAKDIVPDSPTLHPYGYPIPPAPPPPKK